MDQSRGSVTWISHVDQSPLTLLKVIYPPAHLLDMRQCGNVWPSVRVPYGPGNTPPSRPDPQRPQARLPGSGGTLQVEAQLQEMKREGRVLKPSRWNPNCR